MTVSDIHSIFSRWAPKDIAWERDNVGLQVGDMNVEVAGILVALDCTERIVAEAKTRNANLIVTHHPLLFRPPKTITPSDGVGSCIRALIANSITLYSAHTNLDFTRGGVSFAVAAALGLREVDFLRTPHRVQKKIVTFVPEEHVAKVRDAMAAAGAGMIGNYDHCSFGTIGAGSFRGNEATNPTVGEKGKLEQVSEVRLEMIANQWDVPHVVQAMRASHPYEEVACDVYALENASNDFGNGVIGALPKAMRIEKFLTLVKKSLGAKALRRTVSFGRPIRKVAACGGAGADLIDTAIARGADAFITADVRYHDFHHATGRIVLVDAGHYETEHLVVEAVVKKLKKEFAALGKGVPVSAARQSTNPIFYS
jgi:dinuclear metal center YbgI/SA1388 family protein